MSQALPSLSLPAHPYPGLLIAISGMDGAGKSTLVEETTELLSERGYRVTLSRQPSERVRAWPEFRSALAAGESGARRRTLAGLVAWDRLAAQLDEVTPALDRGDAVICERYVLDICVFGTYRGASPEWLAAWTSMLYRPDLALVADVPVKEATRRLAARAPSGKSDEQPAALAELLALYRAAAARYGATLVETTTGRTRARAMVADRLTALLDRRSPARPELAVLLGSTSDERVLAESGLLEQLNRWRVPYEVEICSSDRDPERLRRYCLDRQDWLRLVIACAGGVPNLPVVVKSWLPHVTVLSVPLDRDPAMALASLTTPSDRPVLVVGWGPSGLAKAGAVARDLLGGMIPERKPI